MIGPATGWFEIKHMEYNNNFADAIGFYNTQLSRYPRPRQFIIDIGSEFKRNFKPLLETYGVKSKYITIPQENTVLDRIYQVVGGILRYKDLENYNFQQPDPWSDILASTV